MKHDYDKAALMTYVVCATSSNIKDWVIFKPHDQKTPISDAQVYATVKKAKGIIPYSFKFQRVEAINADDARSKAEGNALEYKSPAIVLRQKGYTIIEKSELQALRQEATRSRTSDLDDIFKDILKPKR